MIDDFLHVGISVEDLDKTIDFYTTVMGMEEDFRAEHGGEIVATITKVKGSRVKVCHLKKGNVRLELLNYENRVNANECPPQNLPGLAHIAFVVTDIAAEYEKIKGLGYQFNSEPVQSRANGPTVCYFTGPDNVVIELYQLASDS